MSIEAKFGQWGPAITGWGSHSSHKFSNEDLIERHNLTSTSEKIIELCGIEERGIEDNPKIATSHLGSAAGKRALNRAHLSESKVDRILFANTTPDDHLHATATLAQSQLRARHAAGVDINAACAGSLFSMDLAFALAESRRANNILVIGADKLSTVVDWDDPKTCILFADGGGAVVIQNTNRPARLAKFDLHSNGDDHDWLSIPAGGSRNPLTPETLAAKQNKIKMNGREVFKFAVKAMSESLIAVAEKSNVSLSSIRLLIPHQANLRIIQAVGQQVGKKVNFPQERIFTNIAHEGNTSSASILKALTEAVDLGLLQPGDLVAFTVFGAGFNWGSAIIEWTGAPEEESLARKLTRQARIFSIKWHR